MARGAPGEEVYTPQVQPEDLPRKIVPRLEAVPVGGAFAQAADASETKYRADSATYAGEQLAQLRSQTVQSLQAAKDAQSADEDPSGFTDKFLKTFDNQAKPLTSNTAIAGNPIAQKMIADGVTTLRQTLQDHTLEWQAHQQVAYRENSFYNQVKTNAAVVEAHPELLSSVGSTLKDVANSIGGDPSKRLEHMRAMDSALSEAAANGLSRQNPQAMYDALNHPENASPAIKNVISGLSGPQREALLAKSQAHIASGYSDNIVAAYRDGGASAGAKALAAVEKIDAPPEIKAQIRADVEKGVAQWRDEARQTHAQDVIGLEERLASGKTNPNDRNVALSLYRNGVFTPQQTGETIGRIEKAQEKKVDDDSIFKYAQASYQKGEALDPKDQNIRKAMDAVFTVATNNVQPGSPEWINRAADIGQKTGVTPDTAISWSRTQLVGGDPASAAKAANAIQRITDANPRGTPFALDDKDKAMAKLINDAVIAGTEPKLAVEHARAVTSMPDAAKLRLDEIYKQKQYAQKSEGDLKSQLKDTDNGFRAHFWNGIPDVPPQMTGQFEELRKTYFKLTGGDVDQATKLSVHDLKNTWGISQVNGKKEFLQFAPEAMNPGLTTEAVRADLEAAARGHTDDPSKVRLLTTADTYQSNGQRWGLGIPDKFGAYSVLTDEKGRVIPYQLPTATQIVKDNAAKAATEGMARLHVLQQKERAAEKAELGEVYNQQLIQGGH
jgi:hypothetical protein